MKKVKVILLILFLCICLTPIVGLSGDSPVKIPDTSSLSTIEIIKLTTMIVGAFSSLIALFLVLWKIPRWFQRVEDKLLLGEQTFTSIKSDIKKLESDVSRGVSEIAEIKGFFKALTQKM